MGNIERWDNTITGIITSIISGFVSVPIVYFTTILDHPSIDEFVGLSVMVRLSPVIIITLPTLIGLFKDYKVGTIHTYR